MGVVSLVRAESLSERTVGARGVIRVMADRIVGSAGISGGELLLLLLLEQIVVPVVLLPLCVHDGMLAGTRVRAVTSSCLSKLKKCKRKVHPCNLKVHSGGTGKRLVTVKVKCRVAH